jgi:NAD(P)-dependent dehydrogenase (short-subunit alcohol dehydrogenase family)
VVNGSLSWLRGRYWLGAFLGALGGPVAYYSGHRLGAVNGLTLSLGNELSPRVRVNAIAPSLTRTQLSKKLLSNVKMVVSIAEIHALQWLGIPEDIAAITAFLLSPEAYWITGQIIGVDGGRSTLRTKG